MNALTYNGHQARTHHAGITTGEIVGGSLSLSSITCRWWWHGQPAILMFQYSNSTAKVTTLATNGMTLYNVSGCSGLFNTGDVMTLNATYTVSPAQVIDSP